MAGPSLLPVGFRTPTEVGMTATSDLRRDKHGPCSPEGLVTVHMPAAPESFLLRGTRYLARQSQVGGGPTLPSHPASGIGRWQL